ncbi:hypothetical protein J6590_091148 [Homalodisca vitripennis]|nr:hypothetical protein J6590_091148 [Homalodisca vitripennis]
MLRSPIRMKSRLWSVRLLKTVANLFPPDDLVSSKEAVPGTGEGVLKGGSARNRRGCPQRRQCQEQARVSSK